MKTWKMVDAVHVTVKYFCHDIDRIMNSQNTDTGPCKSVTVLMVSVNEPQDMIQIIWRISCFKPVVEYSGEIAEAA